MSPLIPAEWESIQAPAMAVDPPGPRSREILARIERTAYPGLTAGLVTALAVQGLMRVDDRYMGLQLLIVVTTILVLGTLAGAAAVWRLPRTGDPETLRAAQTRQGLLAGVVTGAACGMLLTGLFVTAVFMLVLGPVLGAMGGALGGLLAADHPLRPRLARNWAAGLFARN